MPNFPQKLMEVRPNGAPPIHMPGVLERLKACRGVGDDFDRHVLGCAFAAALSEVEYHPLTESLGLDRRVIGEVVDAVFPGALDLNDIVPEDADTGEDAPEEPDFREMLERNSNGDGQIAKWWSSIVARRCQAGDHMWRSMGLFSRKELTEAMCRYFKPLAAKNVLDIRWKKFLYRQLCTDLGLQVCRSPVCDVCPDLAFCTAEE